MRKIIINENNLSVSVFISQGLIERITLTTEFQPESSQDKLSNTITSQLRKYLQGKTVIFDLPLNVDKLTDFQKKVFEKLKEVPAGKTITYEKLAIEAATQNHRRAVAQALAHNPFPMVIPCHRVVAKNGLGGFAFGDEIKKKLLEIERAS